MQGAYLGDFAGVQAFELKQPLTIETGYARSFIQKGKPVKQGSLDKFSAKCSLEVRTVAREGMNLVVQSGAFAITRIQQRQFGGGVFGGALNFEEDFGPVEPAIDIYLASDAQPGVLRLQCNTWEADAIYARPVSLADVRGVLGSVAEIR
ncbi:MAG: hypothetical protein DHS20C01_28300 [marine bacterium B5-7]|nr:MAG: hypothetical protein DHS20C01_28300 [marine bacterium B5-7]